MTKDYHIFKELLTDFHDMDNQNYRSSGCDGFSDKASSLMLLPDPITKISENPKDDDNENDRLQSITKSYSSSAGPSSKYWPSLGQKFANFFRQPFKPTNSTDCEHVTYEKVFSYNHSRSSQNKYYRKQPVLPLQFREEKNYKNAMEGGYNSKKPLHVSFESFKPSKIWGVYHRDQSRKGNQKEVTYTTGYHNCAIPLTYKCLHNPQTHNTDMYSKQKEDSGHTPGNKIRQQRPSVLISSKSLENRPRKTIRFSLHPSTQKAPPSLIRKQTRERARELWRITDVCNDINQTNRTKCCIKQTTESNTILEDNSCDLKLAQSIQSNVSSDIYTGEDVKYLGDVQNGIEERYYDPKEYVHQGWKNKCTTSRDASMEEWDQELIPFLVDKYSRMQKIEVISFSEGSDDEFPFVHLTENNDQCRETARQANALPAESEMLMDEDVEDVFMVMREIEETFKHSEGGQIARANGAASNYAHQKLQTGLCNACESRHHLNFSTTEQWDLLLLECHFPFSEEIGQKEETIAPLPVQTEQCEITHNPVEVSVGTLIRQLPIQFTLKALHPVQLKEAESQTSADSLHRLWAHLGEPANEALKEVSTGAIVERAHKGVQVEPKYMAPRKECCHSRRFCHHHDSSTWQYQDGRPRSFSGHEFTHYSRMRPLVRQIGYGESPQQRWTSMPLLTRPISLTRECCRPSNDVKLLWQQIHRSLLDLTDFICGRTESGRLSASVSSNSAPTEKPFPTIEGSIRGSGHFRGVTVEGSPPRGTAYFNKRDDLRPRHVSTPVTQYSSEEHKYLRSDSGVDTFSDHHMRHHAGAGFSRKGNPRMRSVVTVEVPMQSSKQEDSTRDKTPPTMAFNCTNEKKSPANKTHLSALDVTFCAKCKSYYSGPQKGVNTPVVRPVINYSFPNPKIAVTPRRGCIKYEEGDCISRSDDLKTVTTSPSHSFVVDERFLGKWMRRAEKINKKTQVPANRRYPANERQESRNEVLKMYLQKSSPESLTEGICLSQNVSNIKAYPYVNLKRRLKNKNEHVQLSHRRFDKPKIIQVKWASKTSMGLNNVNLNKSNSHQRFERRKKPPSTRNVFQSTSRTPGAGVNVNKGRKSPYRSVSTITDSDLQTFTSCSSNASRRSGSLSRQHLSIDSVQGGRRNHNRASKSTSSLSRVRPIRESLLVHTISSLQKVTTKYKHK